MEILCMDCKEIHIWGECPYKGVCLFCKERKATMHFGDMLSLTHGGKENCCDLCCARMQLEHAQERAASIPELAAKLAELEKAEIMKNALSPIERAFKDDGEPF
jgi:hypothetical protein